MNTETCQLLGARRRQQMVHYFNNPSFTSYLGWFSFSFLLQKCNFLFTCNFGVWNQLPLSKIMGSFYFRLLLRPLCSALNFWTTFHMSYPFVRASGAVSACYPVRQLLLTSVSIYFRLGAGAKEPPPLPLHLQLCGQIPGISVPEYLALGH